MPFDALEEFTEISGFQTKLVRFKKGILSVVYFYLSGFFIRMNGVFFLKCIFLYYSEVNFGNENWGKDISENENHLKTLHKGGN